MLSQNQILFGNKRLQEVAISWDVPILKAARILAGKEINMFWKWINADEFLNLKLDDEEEKKKFAEDYKTHEKPSEFVHECYSGLNWRDAKHLIGKIIECTNYPNEEWKSGILTKLNSDLYRSGMFEVYHKNHNISVSYEYIRTVKESFKQDHPTISVNGIELPKPETVAPELGTKYWLAPACHETVWYGYDFNVSALKAGRVHLTEERAKAWTDWWKTTVIDKIQ